jgi:hypothetical protein
MTTAEFFTMNGDYNANGGNQPENINGRNAVNNFFSETGM